MRRICLLLSLPIVLWAAEPKVSVAVHSDRVSEWSPIDAVVSISCDSDQEVDIESLELQGEPIKATYSHQSVESSLLIINGRRSEKRLITTHYLIELPGRPAGRHLLPPLTLSVGKEKVTSPATTYVVYGAESSSDFRLEALVEGGTALYPGQRCTLVYRVTFADPVEPTHEELPLFASDAFRKLGDPEIVYDYRGGMTIQEIRQKAQALAAGELRFGRSVIEGFPYAKDFFGNRLRHERRMRAEAPPLELSILPFPSEGRPAHFDGAIGNLVIKSQLLTSSTPRVGDKMRLRVDLVGKAEWATIHPPLLGKQPRFTEKFRLSDLPSAGEEGVGRKSFTLELRPLSAGVQEIPPIKYALFDPAIGGYRLAWSPPISIRVEEAPVMQEVEIAQLAPVQEEVVLLEEEEPPFERVPDLYPLDLEEERSSSWLWYSFPLVALLLAAQGWGSRTLRRHRSRGERLTARSLLKRASSCRQDPERGWLWMERALLTWLEERGFGKPAAPEQLPLEGLAGRGRRIWEEINEVRYAPGKLGAMGHLLSELERLLEES